MDAKQDVLMQPKQLRPRQRLRKLPESFDWWDTPEMMPAVRDQECGNCWSNAAIGILENHVFLNTWNQITLSHQQIMDCTYDQSLTAKVVTRKGKWRRTQYNSLCKVFQTSLRLKQKASAKPLKPLKMIVPW